jgi:hypothetical protein
MYLRSCKDKDLQKDLIIYNERICVYAEKIQRILHSEKYIKCKCIFGNYYSEVFHYDWTQKYFNEYFQLLNEIERCEEEIAKAKEKYDAIKVEIKRRQGF